MEKETKNQQKETPTKKEIYQLTAGLEIHQQLDTHKLFCSCPSILTKEAPKFRVERKLNPVIGETGQIDVAAEYEKSKNKTFVYEVFDSNCLVELDEEPPHKINEEALKIALHISLLLNCKIFPVTQIMRKTVVNGSNTSGFQRTTLIAHDGFLETSEGNVSIDYVFLEEDSARPGNTSEESDPELENSKVYKLDRLGIPLVEIATGPHLHSPNQIKEAALKIGEILRACKVKRGIGTIRQDLNISIPGSERVEIKGFQDPRMMITTIEMEVERQKQCVKEKNCKKEVRRANPDGTSSFLRPMPSAARMYPETDLPLLKISRDMVNEAKNTLPKLLSENKSFLKQYGLNEELIKLILDQDKVEDFKSLLKTINNPTLIVKTLTIFHNEVAKKQNLSEEQAEEILNVDVLETILQNVEKGKISENDVKNTMQKIAEGKTIEEAMKKESINLEKEIKQLIKEKPNLSQGAYMGLLMAKFKGKVSGKEIMDELNKILK